MKGVQRGGIGGVAKSEGRGEAKGKDATWREIFRVYITRIIRVVEENVTCFFTAGKAQTRTGQLFRLNGGKGTSNLHTTIFREVEQERSPSNRISTKIEGMLGVLVIKRR